MVRPAQPAGQLWHLPLLLVLIAACSGARGAADVPAGLARVPPTPLPTDRPAPLLLDDIRLPPGFSISLYVDESDLIPARMLALGQADERATVVYVSTAQQGAVFAVVDRLDGSPRTACVLVEGQDVPNGIAYDGATGSLYIAAVSSMTRLDGVDAAALAGCDAGLLEATVIANGTAMPPQEKHANRGLTLSPNDGMLYYTVGAPFDCCQECSGPYCSVWRMATDGSGLEQVAANIRNAAAYTWHPGTGDLLVAAMERTGMGDQRPDDLLVSIPVNGTEAVDWAWPWCHWEGTGPTDLRAPGHGFAIGGPDTPLPGTDVNATTEEQAAECSAVARRPIQALGPHVSPLGVAFWGLPSGSQAQPWPAQYEGTVFVAQHGAFNSSPPIGYRIANVALGPDGRTAAGHSVFAEGWMGDDGEFWGRPTGLLRLPDGSMLVADDYANTVYRIALDGPPPSATSAGCRCSGAVAAAVAVLCAALAVLAWL